jgi:type I restriction enzyme S subunit
MRAGWEAKRLGDVATLQRGFDLPTRRRVNGEVPLVTSSGISDTHNMSAVSGPGVATGRSGSIGNVFFIEADFWPLNTVLYVKDFHGNDPRFVYHLLKHFDLKRFASGTGVPTLNRNFVHDELVNVPPLPEQKRIAAILDEAFEGIASAKANAEKNLQNARAIFESHLQSVFSQRMPGWQQTTLGREVDILAGFAFRSAQYSSSGEDIRLLRGDNIIQGILRWDDVKRWPVNDTEEYERYWLREGDVVVAMDRPWVKAGLKHATITSDDLPSLLVQRTARLRGGANLDNRFLKLLIGSSAFTSHILGVQTGIGVPHISAQQIKAFPFARPPLTAQSRLADNLEALREGSQHLANIYKRKFAALDALKKSLLHHAFAGELTASKTPALIEAVA